MSCMLVGRVFYECAAVVMTLGSRSRVKGMIKRVSFVGNIGHLSNSLSTACGAIKLMWSALSNYIGPRSIINKLKINNFNFNLAQETPKIILYIKETYK